MTEGATRSDPPAAPEAPALLEEGIARYVAGDVLSAHALFERAHRRAPSDPRPMSWYGLTLVLVERNSNLGMSLCDRALRLAGPAPELCLNQARAHLALAQRERAVKAVMRGLAADPQHEALHAAQRQMGWRRRPVLPFLRRSSPLNRWLGKLRHRWSRALHPVPSTTPMMLGVLPPDREAPRG